MAHTTLFTQSLSLFLMRNWKDVLEVSVSQGFEIGAGNIVFCETCITL